MYPSVTQLQTSRHDTEHALDWRCSVHSVRFLLHILLQRITDLAFLLQYGQFQYDYFWVSGRNLSTGHSQRKCPPYFGAEQLRKEHGPLRIHIFCERDDSQEGC